MSGTLTEMRGGHQETVSELEAVKRENARLKEHGGDAEAPGLVSELTESIEEYNRRCKHMVLQNKAAIAS